MMRQKSALPVIGITSDVDGQYLRLKQDYCQAIEDAGGIPLLLPPVADAKPFASMIHALLIPGGHDLAPAYYREDALEHVRAVSRVRSNFEMLLLTEILGMDKPVLGICYGMQLLNVYFGGLLYQDIGTQCPVAINHKNDYHKVVITENRFFSHGVFSVNSSHHQAIRTIGKGLSAIAYSEDQIIEAFCRKDHHFLVGVQWHPERILKDSLSQEIFHSFIRASRETG
jgi:putative glutamine amidotransferase